MEAFVLALSAVLPPGAVCRGAGFSPSGATALYTEHLGTHMAGPLGFSLDASCLHLTQK